MGGGSLDYHPTLKLAFRAPQCSSVRPTCAFLHPARQSAADLSRVIVGTTAEMLPMQTEKMEIRRYPRHLEVARAQPAFCARGFPSSACTARGAGGGFTIQS